VNDCQIGVGVIASELDWCDASELNSTYSTLFDLAYHLTAPYLPRASLTKCLAARPKSYSIGH
jgi:hypothetical protein